MESENDHHHQHQLQDQLVESSSSSSPCYGVSSTHTWTPTAPLNCSEFNSNYNGDNYILHSRHKNDMLSSSPQHNSSMIQDWTNNEAYHGLHLPKIKDELLASMARFTGYDGSSNDIEQRDLNDLSEKLLLKTISSGFSMFNSAGPEFYTATTSTTTTQNCSIPSRNGFLPSKGSFSQIYPSINISSFNQPCSSPNIIPTSFDMNLEAMDLLNPARFSRSSRFSYPSEDEHHHHDNLDIYKEISPSFNLHHHPNLQQSNQRPATNYIPSKISAFPTETTETKRPSILPEAKATAAAAAAAAAKKSRLESRAACPPFKVRKEKLGDRIAALQQLVAPFGKTDTASVLMEAIGYIKFLQNQVETLSVPYMKSCRNKPSRSKQGGSTIEDENEEESRRDLRSRGLCLVPLSCMSYVTSDSGGGMWPPPPPNFTG